MSADLVCISFPIMFWSMSDILRMPSDFWLVYHSYWFLHLGILIPFFHFRSYDSNTFSALVVVFDATLYILYTTYLLMMNDN